MSNISLDGQIFLVELTGCIDSTGDTKTFYFCGGSGGFTTSPTDTPANQFYDPRLLQPADFTRPMFSDITTAGQSTVTWGTMNLENIDGGLDYLMAYAFDNRPVRILVGDPLAPYSSFNVVMECTVQLMQYGYTNIQITLRDLCAALNLQLITHLYGGTNSLPNGVDGTTDIINNPVPRLYGTALNFSPICVNTSQLTYQIHDGSINAVLNVYDQGAALTAGNDYATATLLNAASTTAGSFDTCLAGGYFKLGSSPVGPVTCDANTGATIANRTPAQLIKNIATDMGFGSSVNTSDVLALDAVASFECGIWVSDTSTGLDIIDTIAMCCGAYVGFDNNSSMRMAQLQAPSGSPVLTLDFSQIKDIDLVPTNDAQNGIPVYGVQVTYAVNNTTQTTGLAGSVSAARKTILALPYLTASFINTSIKTQYLSSQLMVRNTCLISATDAQNEATRLFNLYSVQRYAYQLTVKLDTTVIDALNLNGVVLVTLNRFSMNNGKLLRMIQIEADYASTTAILTLWG